MARQGVAERARVQRAIDRAVKISAMRPEPVMFQIFFGLSNSKLEVLKNWEGLLRRGSSGNADGSSCPLGLWLMENNRPDLKSSLLPLCCRGHEETREGLLAFSLFMRHSDHSFTPPPPPVQPPEGLNEE